MEAQNLPSSTQAKVGRFGAEIEKRRPPLFDVLEPDLETFELCHQALDLVRECRTFTAPVTLVPLELLNLFSSSEVKRQRHYAHDQASNR